MAMPYLEVITVNIIVARIAAKSEKSFVRIEFEIINNAKIKIIALMLS